MRLLTSRSQVRALLGAFSVECKPLELTSATRPLRTVAHPPSILVPCGRNWQGARKSTQAFRWLTGFRMPKEMMLVCATTNEKTVFVGQRNAMFRNLGQCNRHQLLPSPTFQVGTMILRTLPRQPKCKCGRRTMQHPDYSSVGRASDCRICRHQMVPGSIPGGRI